MLFTRKRTSSAVPVKIGIAGVGHNTGVTTISIALANYLCSKRRKATAYMELGAAEIDSLAGQTLHMDIPQRKGRRLTLHPGPLQESRAGKESVTFFRLFEVDYYPRLRPDQLPYLSTAEYRYCVLDLGIIDPATEIEFLRCDLKILVCDLAPWKRELTGLLLQEMTQDKVLQKQITLLGRGANIKPPLFSPAEYSYRLLDFPYLPNPFHLPTEVFDFFEKLLTGV